MPLRRLDPNLVRELLRVPTLPLPLSRATLLTGEVGAAVVLEDVLTPDNNSIPMVFLSMLVEVNLSAPVKMPAGLLELQVW